MTEFLTQNTNSVAFHYQNSYYLIDKDKLSKTIQMKTSTNKENISIVFECKIAGMLKPENLTTIYYSIEIFSPIKSIVIFHRILFWKHFLRIKIYFDVSFKTFLTCYRFNYWPLINFTFVMFSIYIPFLFCSPFFVLELWTCEFWYPSLWNGFC